ncbi:undecaprenyl-diphosphatase UppP [Candidatus Peribacteria bacterium]|nr:undecaprenyl-diphosphatase UppP [Candidatus Peribacteria bacterium]
MTFLHIAIFALVEGVTEFLPVSSTGHLILTAQLLHLPQTEVQKTFEIAIQMGAILAVAVLYGRTLLMEKRTMLLVGAAFVPTAVIGFLLHGVVKSLLGNTDVVLLALFLGGIVLLVFERFTPTGRAQSIREMTVTQAFLIGICQSVALVPGVSRSAATIVGGEFLGVSRKTAVEFSFLLAIPTMAAATGYDVLKSAGEFTSADVLSLAIGFVLSFLVALAAVKWFVGYIQRNSFAAFGVYRIVIALAFFLFLR